MKFGAKLQTFVVPEWSDKYIRYKELARLAKRGSRINSGVIPGKDDPTEVELLKGIFNPESYPPVGCESDLYKSTETDLTSDVPPFMRQGYSIDSQLRSHYSITIPEEEHRKSAPALCTTGKYIPPNIHPPVLPEDVEDQTDNIKLAVYQYEECGHVSNPYSEIKVPESLRHEMATLDRLDAEDEQRDAMAYGTCNDNRAKPKEADETVNHGSVTITPGTDVTSGARLQGHNTIEEPNFNMALISTKGPERKKRWFSSLMGVCAPSSLMRFNLNKNTKHLDDESIAVFHKVLRDDIRVVLLHYVTEIDYIKSLIRFLKADIARRGGKVDEAYAGLIRKACTAFWDSCDKLKLYLNLNTLAVYKVLKKKDKLLGTRDVFNLFPTYKSIMLSVECSTALINDVIQIYNSLMEQPVIDFSVLKSDMESTLDSLRSKPVHGLFYVYGLCTILFANALFLCSFNFPLPFDLGILLSQISPFRFFFAMSLIWWGFGWCQNYLETYGVNYQFQFHLSSNYSATDKDYYEIGAGQTFATLLLFMFFLLDCRLHIVPEHHLYFIYPTLLVILNILIVLTPNRNLKLKIRKRLLISILRVLGAPFGAGQKVTLAESIIADVMTSLTRSLRDLVFMITYFIVGIKSDYKVHSPLVESWIIPIVMCYPYIVRFSQCFRRYINERRGLHFGNMAKYISGISCVIVSSVDWVGYFNMDEWHRRVLITVFYLTATIYQCYWDVVVDWGLNIGLDMFKTRQNRRMYRKQAYYCAVVFNLACRCTWALTTTPFALLKNKELSSEIVGLIIIVIEIVRRIVWVTFRLESEHLLNSYKYRTALWVPKLYNCKNLIVKEMKMLNEQL
ncbi:EXS (signal transduction mechanisms) family protein [Babesia bovis T2Bo]|uniref:EXS family protein n=1 Tax=Babesia bovis TaxID=5865 RepID=A7AUR6_BABBO|nr:EXS (signal transduction mechanisms) family protein [Babesia bovis T2Bo]EDO06677.1 EXS (signal transduction mechanisms) family protein [Babesia bovis T2Bo]|eukprot:XP_001610245.1 EXS family protein [Babesia bovis T2Bo]